MDSRNVARNTLIVLLLLILIALAWWYFMLRTKTTSYNELDSGRGFGELTPEAPALGSSYQNATMGSGSQTSNGMVEKNLGDTGVTYRGGAGDAATTRGVDVPLNGAGGNVDITVGNSVGASASSTGKNGAPPPGVGGPRFKTPQVWHIQKTPIGGFGFVKSTTTVPLLYFVERSTGYLLSAHLVSGNITRLSNTLIPKVYDALIARDGATVLRTLDAAGRPITLAASPVEQTKDGIPHALMGTALDKSIGAITGQVGDRSLFYTIDQGDKTIGYVAQWDGSKKRQVFSLGVGNWRLFALTDGQLVIVQQAEDSVPGFAYRIEKSGRLTPLARSIQGLTVVPQDGSSRIIYSSSDGLEVNLFSKASPDAAPQKLSINTVADKCAWAKGTIVYCAVPQTVTKRFLHWWYMGVAHSSDTWWKVDTSTGKAEIFNPSTKGDTPADVLGPVIDSTGSFLAFRDARDQSLWVIRLNP